MKNLYFLLALFSALFTTNAQIVNIPDPNFKAKLIDSGIDTNTDGEIQQSETLNVTHLNIDSSNISSLEGIQNFSTLTTLWCSNNPLTEVNLCGTAVFTLFCENNPNLTTINLKNNIISDVIYSEPPFPPFWAQNLPSLQYVCSDAGELLLAQALFTDATSTTITFTSDCDTTNCSSLLNTPDIVSGFTAAVYPNPVKDVLNLSIKENTAIQSIYIYNTLGQLVQSDKNPTQTINVSGLKTGSYFIKIISDKGTASSKFIKE